MKNLIVAIGGTGGNAVRCLKYRLKLFNTGEPVAEVYIDTLDKRLIVQNKTDDKDQVSETFFTLGDWDVNSYADYRGEPIEDLARLLERDPKNEFTPEEAVQRYAYRWFQAHYYRQVGASGVLMNVVEGAGRWRQFGRMVIDRNYDTLTSILDQKIKSMEQKFKVYIVFSLAGGTGAGGAYDTAMILRHLAEQNGKDLHMYAFIVMGSAFGLKDPSATYAALRELFRLRNQNVDNRYTVYYNASTTNQIILQQPIFDTMFVIDFKQKASGLEDNQLRFFGLYPALADMIELLTQKEASNYIFQASANWPRDVNDARLKSDNETFQSEAGYQVLKKSLNEDDNWFVTYKVHRIYFPKSIYLEISRNKLLLDFLGELFPRNQDGTLQEHINYDGVTRVSDEILADYKVESHRILWNWNPQFINSVVDFKEQDKTPFSQKKLVDKWDRYGAYDLIPTLFNDPRLSADEAIVWLSDYDIVKECSDSLVKSKEDLDTFNRAVQYKRQSFEEELRKRLATPDNANKNRIRLEIAKRATELLNRPKRTGALGFARAVFTYLGEKYLSEINIRLLSRQQVIREEITKLEGVIRETHNSLAMEFKRKKQTEVLDLEQDRLEQVKRLQANAKLIEYVEFAISEAKSWQAKLQQWSDSLTFQSVDSLRAEAENEIKKNEQVLRELAMSAGICVGLPEDEFPTTSATTDGGRTFDSVKIWMGGFYDHFHSLLQPKELLDNWRSWLKWHAKIPAEFPIDRLLEESSLSVSLASTDQERELYGHAGEVSARLRDLVNKYSEVVHSGINLFTYLTDFVPKRDRIEVERVAKMIGDHFRHEAHFLDFNRQKGIWHSYLLYRGEGADIINFVSKVGQYYKGNEADPLLINQYSDGNVLVLVQFVVGLTVDDAESLTAPRKAYLDALDDAARDKNRNQFRLGAVLSNHVFPEDQEMLRFEIEDVGAKTKQKFTENDFTPLELAPLFRDMNRLDMFVKLYAVELVKTLDLGGRLAYSFTRRNISDGQFEEGDVFILSRTQSILDAARAFVNDEPNKNARARFNKLPSLDELQSYLFASIRDFWLSQPAIKEKLSQLYSVESSLPYAFLVNALERKKTQLLDPRTDLESEFHVPYGIRRRTPQDRLRGVFLVFFDRAMQSVAAVRDEIVRKNSVTDWDFK